MRIFSVVFVRIIIIIIVVAGIIIIIIVNLEEQRHPLLRRQQAAVLFEQNVRLSADVSNDNFLTFPVVVVRTPRRTMFLQRKVSSSYTQCILKRNNDGGLFRAGKAQRTRGAIILKPRAG